MTEHKLKITLKGDIEKQILIDIFLFFISDSKSILKEEITI